MYYIIIAMLSDKAINWFSERGISKPTLEKMKIRQHEEWMPQTGKEMTCIAFDYFHEGETINTKFRDGKKNFKLVQGAPKIFYNVDALCNDDNDSIVVVEGEIDALSFIESGIDYVISVPNGATKGNVNADYLDDFIDYFDSKERVILALDDDEAGQNLQQEFIRRLGPESCYLANLDGCKDANEYLTTHGSSLLRDVVANAQICPLENVYTATDIKEELVDYIENGSKKGYQIGIPAFDNIFSTYTSQFITVTGIPTHGKSDFIDRMCVGYNRNYGWKTAYASPENLPMHIHTDKLIRKIAGCRPAVGTEEFEDAFNKVDNNFFFIGMDRFYLDDVLAKGAELVKRKGIKVLVIDPFNKVKMTGVPQERVNEYTMEYLQRIDQFAKKHDCLVIIAAHPTKMYKGPDGKQEMPNFYSVKGGGEWFDASYHGLVVHRDFDANTTKIKVLKVKFQNLGTNGAELDFTWEPEAGEFVPINEPSIEDMIGPDPSSGVKPQDPNELNLW